MKKIKFSEWFIESVIILTRIKCDFKVLLCYIYNSDMIIWYYTILIMYYIVIYYIVFKIK
jgi:hypothetical protein